MTKLKVILLSVAVACSLKGTLAQVLSQTIRGTIVDKTSHTPLPGSNVIILDTQPVLGATTDTDGNFKITNVPVGTHAVKVTFIGYKEKILPLVIVNSGKEVVLNIPIEEDIVQMKEIVVRATQKEKPINDMAVVSARTFSVEETRKFAAAVNDPARMVTSFAGVIQTDDGNNNVSIRGNSPYGLQWRMEGVDIPNPNHFANTGTAGGGISILSSQLLTNSDFMTGAFPAEYGNALSGVFDLQLRKGNNEKPEYTLQAGFLGIDVAAEGPFSKNYKGSYLINYRYSTLSILDRIGVSVGDAVTNFQDLSFNIHLPTNKWGSFSLFGFGGLSDQHLDAKKDSTSWDSDDDRFNNTYVSNTGAVGLRHSLVINRNTHLQTSLLFSGNENGDKAYKLDDSYSEDLHYHEKYIHKKITLTTVLNHKFSPSHSVRTGVYLNKLRYEFYLNDMNEQTQQLEELLNAGGTAEMVQAFGQWNFRASEKITFNAGLHYLKLLLNKTSSIEPRASVSYTFKEGENISVGYGLHGQIQPLGSYFAQIKNEDGSYTRPNENLDLTKSHHAVLAYDNSLNDHLRLKIETYYQHLFDIPISPDENSTLALINTQGGFETDPLVNKGIGRNYGLELTLEQFMHNNLYFVISSSFYDSRYKAADGVWRNTRYNGNYSFNITAGKEFIWKKDRVFGINFRTVYSGGFRDTPIDVEKSMQNNETEYIEALAFSEKLPDYFRTDLRLSLKRNKPKSTHTLALDIQNISNHENIFGRYFDPFTGEVKTAYQLPLLPVLSYKVEF
jgi:hypothetical protein